MSSSTRSNMDETLRKVSMEFSTAARALAAEALRRVEVDDAYANLILPAMLNAARLAKRDAALATELTYGTLRSQGFYDTVLQFCAKRSVQQIDPELRPILRMGVHQLLAMRVPAHAAVDQTVRLAKEARGLGAGSFANAVLRAVSERSLQEWYDELLHPQDISDVEYLAQRYSHPEWVVRALRESLVGAGRPVAEIADLLTANNEAARVSVALLPGFGHDVDQLTPGQWAATAATLPPGDPKTFEMLDAGTARVQDEGSQLAALILGAAELTGADSQWADVCAGPGGKAALLAAQVRQRGGHLTAVEAQSHRAELVRTALKAMGSSTTVIAGDGRSVGEDHPERFDRVLVDVPCTGLGALRRRPEARWRRSPADLASLTPLQRELLKSAVAATRPGGVIAYVTCSPHPAETRLVVNDIVRSHDDVVPVDAVDVLLDVAASPMPDTAGPMIGTGAKKRRSVQLWPHLHGTDAMFIALLHKLP